MDFTTFLDKWGWPGIGVYFSTKLLFFIWKKVSDEYISPASLKIELDKLSGRFESHMSASISAEKEQVVLIEKIKNIEELVDKNHISTNRKLDDIWKIMERIQEIMLKMATEK